MLISHQFRFVFVKTRKTAGTSIELALSPRLGALDVVTPIAPESEALRLLDGVFPRNYVTSAAIRPGIDLPDAASAQAFIRENARHTAHPVRFFNHMPARDIRRHMGRELWKGYHSFCVERIPYDRLLSFYRFRKTRRKELAETSFSEMVRMTGFDVSNSDLYTHGERVIVSEIIPYHRLSEHLAALAAKLGLGEVVLPVANVSPVSDARHWSEVIGPEDRAYIDRTFAKEFEALDMTPAQAWLFEG